MQTTVKDVLDKHTNFKLDRRFIKDVLQHVSNFIRKDENSINFFGGNLIGVYPVKWLNEDKELWLDLIGIDDLDSLRDDINAVEGINPEFRVSSDPINLSFVYVAFRALKDKSISSKDSSRLANAVINMLQYKFISSLHTRRFKYPANEDIALAVYESLDRKSGLKKHGSWQALIEAKTEDILDLEGLWSNTLRTMTNTENIVKMLNDIQGRIRSILNTIVDKFYIIRDADSRIRSTDKFTTIEGEKIVKDSVNKYNHTRIRIHSIIPDRNSFITDDILSVIQQTVPTVTPRNLEEVLKFISENYHSRKLEKELRELVDDMIIYTFTLMIKEKIPFDNIPAISIKLRSMYRSSRVSDPLIKTIRERIGVIVSDVLDTNSNGVISSTKIAVTLYIVLRALLEG